MPVSGLVVTIDPTREAEIRAALHADPRTEAHDLIGPRLVVALDTPSREADEGAWHWLRAVPGVLWIDLAWISIEAAETSYDT